MTTAKKAFTILVNKKEYDVWNIPNKKHKALNGEVDTWWLYYSDSLPEGTLPPLDSEHWLAYHVSMKRNMWDVLIESYQTTKIKWDDYHFRNGYRVKLLCDKKLIHSFSTHNIEFAMSKAQYLMIVLPEHPFNFLDQDSEKNRKIYYYGMPALVDPKRNGEIGIIPDYTTIKKVDWWKEYYRRQRTADGLIDKEWEHNFQERFEEDSDYINWGDALSDGNIDWFRSLKESDNLKKK